MRAVERSGRDGQSSAASRLPRLFSRCHRAPTEIRWGARIGDSAPPVDAAESRERWWIDRQKFASSPGLRPGHRSNDPAIERAGRAMPSATVRP
jgi:hypothetical protein